MRSQMAPSWLWFVASHVRKSPDDVKLIILVTTCRSAVSRAQTQLYPTCARLPAPSAGQAAAARTDRLCEPERDALCESNTISDRRVAGPWPGAWARWGGYQAPYPARPFSSAKPDPSTASGAA